MSGVRRSESTLRPFGTVSERRTVRAALRSGRVNMTCITRSHSVHSFATSRETRRKPSFENLTPLHQLPQKVEQNVRIRSGLAGLGLYLATRVALPNVRPARPGITPTRRRD